MSNLFFNMVNHQLNLENYAKSSQQLMDEQRDRAARINARISSPGYSRVMIRNPDGSHSIRRIYTADYLQYEQSDRAWALYKVLYSLFLVAGVILSFLVMLSPSALNRVYYIGALEAFSLLPLLYLLYTMFYQISAPRRMKIRQYEMASKRMRIGAFVYGLYLIVLLAAMLAYVITNDFSFSSVDVLCMAGFLLDAVLIFLMFGLETKRHHTSVQNKLPDSMEIMD